MIVLLKEDLEKIRMIKKGLLTYRRGLFDPRVADFLEESFGWR